MAPDAGVGVDALNRRVESLRARLTAMAGRADDERDGVSLTNLDQPLFDGADATKRDLVDYLDARARPDHSGAARTGRCR